MVVTVKALLLSPRGAYISPPGLINGGVGLSQNLKTAVKIIMYLNV